ncbi:hypothetical protein [Paracraurococcus lichenis]|uniref:Uncharacterized protein n=1 Tax=Paracraurococcus lichenis TaxID=3064888 RepID=A0ABT9DXY0_9PROT|nr:hypothetical protein [Paracraurococcus sp. LOR1-02]MDO9708759.1 hypothetical protein [Paracraurococcus sp. LOR1-02]
MAEFAAWNGQPPSVPVRAALLVTLIPTTIGGLLPAIPAGHRGQGAVRPGLPIP